MMICMPKVRSRCANSKCFDARCKRGWLHAQNGCGAVWTVNLSFCRFKSKANIVGLEFTKLVDGQDFFRPGCNRDTPNQLEWVAVPEADVSCHDQQNSVPDRNWLRHVFMPEFSHNQYEESQNVRTSFGR